MLIQQPSACCKCLRVVCTLGDNSQVKIRLSIVKETIKARSEYKQFEVNEAFRKILAYLQVGIMQKLSSLYCWLIFGNEAADLTLEFVKVRRLSVNFRFVYY
jgi:hypothetical protein